MTVGKKLVTAEELYRHYGDVRCELLDGEVVELSPAGGKHNRVTAKFTGRLLTHVEAGRLGEVLAGDTGILLRRNPDRVRAPDVCFIAASRVPPGGVPEGFLEIVPDLVIEVVSPTDRLADVRQKTQEWLQAGARLVWTAFPASRIVEATDSPGRVCHYREGDTLPGAPVLPGLMIPVAELFD